MDPTVSSQLRPDDVLRLVNHPTVSTLEQIQVSSKMTMEALWRDLEVLRQYPKILSDFVGKLGDAQMTRVTSNFADKLAVIRDEAVRRGGDLARIITGGGAAGLGASAGTAAAGISAGTIAATTLGAALVLGTILYFTIGPGAADRPMSPGPQAAREHESSQPDPQATPRLGATYCAWYADNIALKPVFVGSQLDFEASTLTNQVQGGGDPDKPAPVMKKVPLVPCGTRGTLDEVIRAACAEFEPAFMAGSTFVHTEWLAVRKSTRERHDIDNLGGCHGR
jgi:hypothetical protein